MTLIVKGLIRPRPWGGKQPVVAINGHATPLWPPDHLQKVETRAEMWLRYGYASPHDTFFTDYTTMLEEIWRARRCNANFKTIQTADIKPHTRAPWFSVWGSLTSAYFTSRNLVEVLYSPEWRVGIVRNIFRVTNTHKPGRYFNKLTRDGVIVL